jgi:hypothetical protein
MMRLQEELFNHAREAVSAGLTAIESGVHMYHDGPDLFFECTPASKAIVQKFMDDQSQDTADHRRLNRKDHRDYIEDLCMGLEDREDGQPSFHGPFTLTTGSQNISLYIDEEKGTIWYWAPGMNDFFWKFGVRDQRNRKETMEFVRHCPYRFAHNDLEQMNDYVESSAFKDLVRKHEEEEANK